MSARRETQNRHNHGHHRTRISRALSFVLRHGARSQGVRLDEEGFGHVRDVLDSLAMRMLHVSRKELDYVVDNDIKSRFAREVILDQHYLKAVQGHSIPGLNDGAMHTPVTLDAGNLPGVSVHGTFWKHLSSIREHGLLAGGLKGTRGHIHFQTRDIGDDRVVSGMRGNCEVAVYIDLEAALRAGVKFFLSDNGVLLTPGVRGVLDARFISRIMDLGNRQSLYPNQS